MNTEENQAYHEPQIIQTSITDKTIKDIGELVVSVITLVNDAKIEGEIQVAKAQAEIAKTEQEIYLEQLKSDERTTNTVIKWDTYFKTGVLIVSFGTIILLQYLGSSDLTTTIVPVITFILGSVFKNTMSDFFKVSTKKKSYNTSDNESN